MNYYISVHELFWIDVAEARIYYETVSVQIADRFDKAFDKAYKKLGQNPEAYFNLSKTLRRIRLSNFPYQIIYSFKSDTIHIWCLHHAASSKKEWSKRRK